MTTGEAMPVTRGWYQRSDDPHGVQRWFNGSIWTEQTTGQARPDAIASPTANGVFEVSSGVSVTTTQPFVPPPASRGWHEYPGDPKGVQRWYSGSRWTNQLTGGSAVDRADAVKLPGLATDLPAHHPSTPNPTPNMAQNGFIPMMYNPATGQSAYVDPTTGYLRVRPRYSNGRRVGYSLLWAFYTVLLVIGGTSSLANSQVATGLIGLGLAVLTGRYAMRIWTYRARTLWLLLFF